MAIGFDRMRVRDGFTHFWQVWFHFCPRKTPRPNGPRGFLQNSSRIIHLCASWLGIHLDQFNLKNKGGIRRDGSSGRRTCAIGQVLRNVKCGFAAFLHQLKSFSPTANDAIQWKRNGFSALVTAVELLSIEQRSTVVNGDLVVGVRSGS